jgi:phosphoglycolate phosphatase
MLVLFDIDGTMLDAAMPGAGEAMSLALQEVHGVDTTSIRTHIPTAGRTDGEIARAILLDAGISAERIDALAERVRDRCCEWCARLFRDDLSGYVLPGVRDLLDWLAEQPNVKLALLTGNYEPVARLKMTRAGLGHAFALGQGAFGSGAEDRAALPAIARRRAGTSRGPYPRRDTIVVGDTPLDIACARADAVRCVAVATGAYTVAELAAADLTVSDAYELRHKLAPLGIWPAGH